MSWAKYRKVLRAEWLLSGCGLCVLRSIVAV